MATQLSTTIERDDKRTLVVVFLRGGADGLSLVVPREDDHYYRARQRLAVKKESTLNLDGTFGLHPHLAPLEAAWKDGELAIVHAAGCEDDTRSHFEAQDLMEHGGFVAGGWLGRFLRAKGPGTSPLSAVALSPTMPDVLSGAPSAVAFQRIEEFSIGRKTPEFPRELRRLYELESGGLRTAADNTFEAMQKIDAIDTKATPANGAAYTEKDDFHQGLRQVAQLIRADVGLDAASVDLNGWDTHFGQELAITGNIVSLGAGLAAFRKDMGARMATTTVVVMTEFGRTLAENTSFGTDHGNGGVMFVMGGGVRGGRMLGEWRGLDPKAIVIKDADGKERTNYLPVWTNYRDVLAPILTRHGAPDSAMGKIFPDYALKPLAIYS